ncbi:MAG: transglutaminase family protein, partial [Dehalococcoidia bacterium]|nr:transglutaminase family protein [Dehalococcoidia bacterium]
LLRNPPVPGEITLNTVEYDISSSRYLDASPLVKPEMVTDAARRIAPDSLGLLETVGAVVDWVHANIRYERGATSVATSAEHILETRTGVCQDMTHLAIALLRALGIPTRYVSGLLATQAGETHAWIEFLHPGLGWLPADPTRGHRLSVDDDLIKFAIGMDYTQASPVEGTFVSPGAGHLDIAVGKALPDDRTPSLEDARNLIRNSANV